MMETTYMFKAAVDGFLLGWGICYIVCCASERRKAKGKGGK